YKNIQFFNSFLENSFIFNDGVLKGIFFKRGFELSKIIIQKIQKEENYLYLIVKVYKDWLILLIEKLNIRKQSLEKLFL
ncbi:DUF115 domain-containing protein, partial [Campylobacter jejuni]|nr:DUF115 domain-containing protein [Campylobacter jejuni]